MREVFAATDTRLPPVERARLGASGSVFASPQVRGLYDLLFAEAWPVTVNPGRFRSDEARMRVLGRTAGILGELEAAIRRELGADQIPPARSPVAGAVLRLCWPPREPAGPHARAIRAGASSPS
jgi:hypothetical protein